MDKTFAALVRGRVQTSDPQKAKASVDGVVDSVVGLLIDDSSAPETIIPGDRWNSDQILRADYVRRGLAWEFGPVEVEQNRRKNLKISQRIVEGNPRKPWGF